MRENISRKKIPNDSGCFELGIEIVKQMDDFKYKFPILRVLMGINNIMLYINRINRYTFPNLKNTDIYPKILEKYSIILENFYINDLNFVNGETIIMISGFHNCFLNCGECCDGADRTKSPLEGGMYCKALTNIGNLCMYQLSNLEYPEENTICREFFCGDIQCSNDLNVENLGCQVRKFITEYSKKDMDEFFNNFRKIKTKKLHDILNSSQRSDEINKYWGSINKIIEISKLKGQKDTIFFNKFLYSLGVYNFDNCMEVLHSYKNSGQTVLNKTEISNLELAIVDLKKWKLSFDSRKSLYSNCAVIDV
jgi:hypothetical protein